MDSNTYSTGPPAGQDDDLCALEAVAGRLAARNLDRLPDAVRVERVLGCGGWWPTWSRPPTPTAPTLLANGAMPAGGCGWPDL